MTVEQQNLAFYERHYRAAHPLMFWLHGQLSYDQQSKTRPNLAQLRPALERLLREQPARTLRVLDYGSGFGTLLLALPRERITLHAYDLSERAVTQLQAAARMWGCDISGLDLTAQGAPRGELDVVVCSHVLEHVADDDALLARFASALRPQGLLLLNVPINELWEDPKHARRYDEATLRSLLARHGFGVIELRQLDRVSAFMHARERGRVSRALLRPVRLLLSRAPTQAISWIERAWLAHLPAQQLLVLACVGPSTESGQAT
jgi:2-polyprenyl-3-methyl-5-hydroxy-6-metoxy-1,4-benzoquinol methylase